MSRKVEEMFKEVDEALAKHQGDCAVNVGCVKCDCGREKARATLREIARRWPRLHSMKSVDQEIEASLEQYNAILAALEKP